MSMLKDFRHPKSLLRQRPTLRFPDWHQTPEPSRRGRVQHGGPWVISFSGQMHHGQAITSPWSTTEGSCLTESCLRSLDSRSSWSHAGEPGLGQGELDPSSLYHQPRVKVRLFWKDHMGLNGNKRSYTAGVLNTWAPGPSHRDSSSDDSRQLLERCPLKCSCTKHSDHPVPAFGEKKKNTSSWQKKHNLPASSRGPGHLPGLSDSPFLRGMPMEPVKYSSFWLQENSPSMCPGMGQFGLGITACDHRRWLAFLFVRKEQEAWEQGVTKAYQINTQLRSPFSVF